MTKTNKLLQTLPSVDKLGREFENYPLRKDILLNIIRNAIDQVRQNIINNTIAAEEINDVQSCLKTAVERELEKLRGGSFKKVINGTGIVLHTGLGRAPFNEKIFIEMKETMSGYVNLEFDLKTGRRGERLDHVNQILTLLTPAEKSVVVNNNAAALILLLNTLACRKEVIVSRGELIEIGGSFRIPDVIEKSGALVREAGTTNRTHLKDYQEAISDKTGAILLTHTSNYKIIGFTKSPEQQAVVELGRQHNIPVIMDLGSSDLVGEYADACRILTKGFDAVCFSGDKLLGGPQAGIILGKAALIDALRNNPLYRALRCDKLTLFALERTLQKILSNDSATRETEGLLNRPQQDLIAMGREIVDSIEDRIIRKLGVAIIKTEVETGSGSLPTQKSDSAGLLFTNIKAEKIAEILRNFDIPVIGYIKTDRFVIDLKAVRENEVGPLIQNIKKVSEMV